jgi:hypothetical protein
LGEWNPREASGFHDTNFSILDKANLLVNIDAIHENSQQVCESAEVNRKAQQLTQSSTTSSPNIKACLALHPLLFPTHQNITSTREQKSNIALRRLQTNTKVHQATWHLLPTSSTTGTYINFL